MKDLVDFCRENKAGPIGKSPFLLCYYVNYSNVLCYNLESDSVQILRAMLASLSNYGFVKGRMRIKVS